MATKLCRGCGKVKDLDEFYRRSAVRDGRQSRCKECSSKTSVKWHAARTPSEKARYRAARAERVKELRWLVIEALQVGCQDCGITDLVVLEFDHVGPKDFTISKAVQEGLSKERVAREIAKCEVVCSNCHRRRTASRNPGHWIHTMVD